MSILITGMEMPKELGVYSLDLYVDEVCQIQRLDGSTFEAVEISTPHGRLIDADKLEANYIRIRDDGIKEYTQRAINNAPTVIEAEEVYGQYTDTAGNFHWCGTHSGEHIIKKEE